VLNDSVINIKVGIAERIYPLSIKAEDEETIRMAAKTINDKIKEYLNMYAAKDKQDILAMIAITFAVDNIKNRNGALSDTLSEKMTNPLLEIQQLLEAALQATAV
jgi:cell division protein ZapA (FtsZ GTPase activity inhibitor)